MKVNKYIFFLVFIGRCECVGIRHWSLKFNFSENVSLSLWPSPIRFASSTNTASAVCRVRRVQGGRAQIPLLFRYTRCERESSSDERDSFRFVPTAKLRLIFISLAYSPLFRLSIERMFVLQYSSTYANRSTLRYENAWKWMSVGCGAFARKLPYVGSTFRFDWVKIVAFDLAFHIRVRLVAAGQVHKTEIKQGRQLRNKMNLHAKCTICNESIPSFGLKETLLRSDLTCMCRDWTTTNNES